MTDTPDRPRKRIVIDAPSEAVILAARHLDATEGPVQVGRIVDTSARSAITTVLRYIAKAHNSPPEVLSAQLCPRADNAEERLRLAREALVRDGYFTADEIGDDIAPRLVEWLSHHRDRAEEAEAELTRLRAGEEPGWDPALVPTPGQWIACWNRASATERLDVAERVIRNAAKAGECFEMNHVARLEEDRQARAVVERVRELRDSWLLMTLEPGQVRRLLDGITRALDGQRQDGAVCDAYKPPATSADSGLCARCGMYDYKHSEATSD